ncbi:hypothetical protein SPRG_03790 [Saprolegnia parasitica CBS 223.65]|uniref:Peptidase n=1 Tax=Saprolegnia parasitica (strain CBS 223.65) TaxID=695850 RepID=A0A067CRJ6_SAPPC|nr:hypothetical protein SPRG_03790 [Saprolegnia parasitica CBS 223.65]KDO31870.1 hypothetical protein SPRG_03790 [Saprolegnia parasitica CBS 223.65]|eukprot:XP_012197748.1 hypothetical protein SPRG_03790 [Saprolegnia parasitica CBS 223.65]
MFLAILATLALTAQGCTTIVVGREASTTGSSMVTHAADCSSCDFRIGKVPAKTHPVGARRDIAPFRLAYPRYVGDDRGDVFRLDNVDTSIFNWTATEPLGQIPQVPTTFGYISGVYGVINEHQVAIGESTCGGRLVSLPVSAPGGKALFDVAELTNVAMERANTARDAILLMGALAETYGYYGAAYDTPSALLEAGEALTVIDPNEAWVMHIHPDDTGASAVWAAQRLPHDHIAVVANQFTLRALNLSDPKSFLASTNVEDVAIRAGLYDPSVDGAFDWTAVYAYRRDGAHAPNHYYATRRVWRVLTLANPSIELSPTTDMLATDYPVSVQVAAPLSPSTLMRIHRDHYEGTSFDLTSGPMAGPYGSPDRYDVNGNGNMTKADALRSHQERGLSIFRAAYSLVAVLNAGDPRAAHIWFGPYAPHATAYVPIFAYADAVPSAYATGSLHVFAHDVMYWNAALVGNWAGRFYAHAMPSVAATQLRIETNLRATLARVVETLQMETDVRAFLTSSSASMVATTMTTYASLFQRLVVEFHGRLPPCTACTRRRCRRLALLPEWWLRQVGYFAPPDHVQASASRFVWLLGCLVAVLVTFGVVWMGFTLGSNLLMRHSQGYSSIL